jgi:hypothetical protein
MSMPRFEPGSFEIEIERSTNFLSCDDLACLFTSDEISGMQKKPKFKIIQNEALIYTAKTASFSSAVLHS